MAKYRVDAKHPTSKAMACPGMFALGIPAPRKVRNFPLLEKESRNSSDANMKGRDGSIEGSLILRFFFGLGVGSAVATSAASSIVTGTSSPYSP